MTSLESAPKPLDPEKGSKLFEKMRADLNGDASKPIVSDGIEIFQGGIEEPVEVVDSEAVTETDAMSSIQHASGPLQARGWQAEWEREQERKEDERRKRDAAPLN
ncbi:MAG: hypothetical protein V4524_00020 [Patescibacteria group bacterium]